MYSIEKEGDNMSYIYPTIIKDTIKYKIYFLYEKQKIYLGTYPSMESAEKVVAEAEHIVSLPPGIPDLNEYHLNYKKIISLCNLRDHHHYIKNPIYLYPTYFTYYLSKDCILTFDLKELFYFSTYKIYKRGNYLYTQDSVSQQSILSRYGIPNYSVLGKDYRFKNGDPYDFRLENIEIINTYKGVSKKKKGDTTVYVAYIFFNSNLIIGHYTSELEAAIAYNKAVDVLIEANPSKTYVHNVIPFLTKTEYQAIYDRLEISPRLYFPEHNRKRVISTKKLRGISKDQNSYRAYIGYHGKQLYLGMYPTEKRAAQAYNYASFYLFGRQGYINEVSPLVYDGDGDKIVKFLDKYHILKSPS